MATKTQKSPAPVDPVTASYDPIEKLAGLAELDSAAKPFRDAKKPAFAVVVIKAESFGDPLTLDQRSYRTSTETGLEKADSLAGDDPGVNLALMLGGSLGYRWQVDYCYIPKKQGFPLSVKYDLETPAHREELGPLFGDSPYRGSAERFRKAYAEKGVPQNLVDVFIEDVLAGKEAEAEKIREEAAKAEAAKIKAEGKISDKDTIKLQVHRAGMNAYCKALPSYKAVSDFLLAEYRKTQGASTRKAAATPVPKAETPAPKAETPAKAEKPAPKHEKRLPPPPKAKAKAKAAKTAKATTSANKKAR